MRSQIANASVRPKGKAFAASRSISTDSYAQDDGHVACVGLGRTEVIAVFHRKFRESVIDEAGFQLLGDQFELDCANGLWHWLPVSDHLIHLTALRYRTLGPTIFLRASDAIHLSCAMEAGLSAVYTSDRHMIRAARALGLQAITL